MKSLLDRSFRYTPSYDTNLKATFARVRREMRQAQATPPHRNVLLIKQEKAQPVVRTIEKKLARREAN